MNQRAIKFRGWNKVRKEMVWSGEGKDLHTLLIEQYDPDIKNQMIYLQFTGLIDKHGREVYEGDILRSRYGGKELIGVIGWNNAKSQFGMTIESNSPLPEHLEISEKPEIIGNIFENPEVMASAKIPRV